MSVCTIFLENADVLEITQLRFWPTRPEAILDLIHSKSSASNQLFHQVLFLISHIGLFDFGMKEVVMIKGRAKHKLS